MTLNDLLMSICSQIKTWLPDLKTCEPHGGRFDKNEIKRVSGRAPAVYVAVLATGRPEPVGTGEQDVPVTFAAYAVAIDKPKLSKAVAALNITELLVTRIYAQQWGRPEHVFGAGPASSRNLYSGVIATKGVALWAVTWRQTVRVGDDVFVTDLPMPSTLYLGISPEIGEGHESDYEEINEGSLP